MRNIVFDVCGTLYDINTTKAFIKYILLKDKHLFKMFMFRLYTSKFSVLNWVGQLWFIVFKVELLKIWRVSLLKGYSKTDLEAYAESFYSEVLVKHENKKVLTVFNKFKETNESNLILVSSSINIIVSVIAKQLGANAYYGSQMVFDNDICTGKIKFDLEGKKQKVLETLDTLVTDNKNDVKLMLRAKNNYAVVYNTKDIKFWQRFTNHFIKLY